jgi:ribosome biogenesis SPOUT family RNA methylase Rps3
MHAAPLDKIQYVDYPELRINKNESTEMPFRYVKGKTGESIMPEVSQDKHVQWPA